MSNHDDKIRLNTALLTIGSGPIAYEAFKTLDKYSNLRCVIFSRKKRTMPLWKKVKDYGLWYALQNIISRFTFFTFRYIINKNKLTSRNINFAVWDSPDSAHYIAKHLAQYNVDVVIVCGFQYIIKDFFIDKFKYCINIHPSFLPLYRGPEPIMWGLLRKDETYGISMHLIDSGIDTGDIICQTSVKRPFAPFAALIELKLSKQVKKMIISTLNQINFNSLSLKKQKSGFYLTAPTLRNRIITAKKQN